MRGKSLGRDDPGGDRWLHKGRINHRTILQTSVNIFLLNYGFGDDAKWFVNKTNVICANSKFV